MWQQAELDLLPDVLSMWAIACLWAGDRSDRVEPLFYTLLDAIESGELKATLEAEPKAASFEEPWEIATSHINYNLALVNPSPDCPPAGEVDRVMISRGDFAAFLRFRGIAVPAFWFGPVERQCQGRRAGGLAAHTRDSQAKQFARKIAQDTWNEPGDPDRIGEVASYIAEQLKNAKFGSYKDKTIKTWIRDLAPPYAQRSGRPGKNPP